MCIHESRAYVNHNILGSTACVRQDAQAFKEYYTHERQKEIYAHRVGMHVRMHVRMYVHIYIYKDIVCAKINEICKIIGDTCLICSYNNRDLLTHMHSPYTHTHTGTYHKTTSVQTKKTY